MPDVHADPPGNAMTLHISFGITILALIVLRFVRRITHPVAPESSLPPWQRVSSEAVHWLLYALVLATTVTGWLFASFRGWLVSYFYLVPLPMLAAKNTEAIRQIDGWHQIAEWTLLITIGVHNAAAAVGCCAGAEMVAQAALLTLFVLGGNTLLRPLVNAIDRIPVDEQSSEATYDVLVTTDGSSVASVREFLLEKLEAANYPVRDLDVLCRSGDYAEIVATLVSQSIEPDELDAFVAGLASMPGVRHATWNIRALE